MRDRWRVFAENLIVLILVTMAACHDYSRLERPKRKWIDPDCIIGGLIRR